MLEQALSISLLTTTLAAAHTTGFPPKVDACPGYQALSERRSRQKRTDRQTAAQTLSQTRTVRRHTLMLSSKKVTRTPCARLDLIEQKITAGPVGELSKTRKVARRRLDHPALTLNRLNQNRSGVLADGSLHRLEVAVGDVTDTRQHGLEPA